MQKQHESLYGNSDSSSTSPEKMAKLLERELFPGEQSLEDRLRELWQSFHGHPQFYDLLAQEANLHSAKNHDYAAGGDPMGNFNRVARFLSMYPGFDYQSPYGYAMMLMLKQLDAVMWRFSQREDGQVESIARRLADISVYSKIITILYDQALKEVAQLKKKSHSESAANTQAATTGSDGGNREKLIARQKELAVEMQELSKLTGISVLFWE